MKPEELVTYVIRVFGYKDDTETQKKVAQAREITEKAILKAARWGFLRREKSFNTDGSKTYDLSTALGIDNPDDRIAQVKAGTQPLTYKPPEELDALKAISTTTVESSASDSISYWTVRDRNKNFVPIIELDTTPASILSISVIYFLSSATDYLCNAWPYVLIAGIRACLEPRQLITQTTGAVIKRSIMGQPKGDPEFEAALYDMKINEPIVTEFGTLPVPSLTAATMEEIYNAD